MELNECYERRRGRGGFQPGRRALARTFRDTRIPSIAEDDAAATTIILSRSFGFLKYGFVSLSGFSPRFLMSHLAVRAQLPKLAVAFLSSDSGRTSTVTSRSLCS